MPSQKIASSVPYSQIEQAQPRNLSTGLSQEAQQLQVTDEVPLFLPDSPQLRYPPDLSDPPSLESKAKSIGSQLISEELGYPPSDEQGQSNTSPLKRKTTATPPPLPKNKKRKLFPPSGLTLSATPESGSQVGTQESSEKTISPPLFTHDSQQTSEEPKILRSGRARSTTPRAEVRPSRRSASKAPISREGSQPKANSATQPQPSQQQKPVDGSGSQSQSQSQTPFKSGTKSNPKTPLQKSGSYLESGLQYVSNALRTRVLGRTSPIPEETDEQEELDPEGTQETPTGDMFNSQLMTQAPFTYNFDSQSQDS